MKEEAEIFVGVDVSKDTLDVFDGVKSYRVQAKPAKIRELVMRLKGAKLVVVESTGGYEMALVKELWQAEVPVSIVNPRQVKRFAQGLAVEAKTDKIDAKILQKFAVKNTPRETPRPSDEQLRLSELIDRRRQLIESLIIEKNRAKAPAISAQMNKDIKRAVSFLEKEVKRVTELAQEIINSTPELKAKAEVLSSEHGVGAVLTLSLLSDLPELGTINRNKIGALVGVAPYDNQSGSRDGRRHIRGGRKHIRAILYMATLAAIRRSPVLKPYFIAQVKRGKPKMSALIACMRKLLLILNSKMRAYYQQSSVAMPTLAC